MGKLIPIYKYAEKIGVPKQTVYRWIRENKIPAHNVKKISLVVERLVIDENTIIEFTIINNLLY